MDWIAVQDKLPLDNEPVLVLISTEDDDYTRFNNMQVAYHVSKQWIGKDSGLCDVTHWLPLPPAPKPPRDEHFEAIKFASDSVMSHYIPTDRSAQTFSFAITAEGKEYTAHYEKDVDGYWTFRKYE
ncbi:DUF551 domain-containing protein [Mucilaginibacter agri]|uniref:DUF551 domain-containing protein n=1 Tax=Mucilaginibacter agri TaxID=2695265 RepID=A0A965ZKI2_9SPHI|nr:DUF551 domain-containing protein [Mucilaginibacter agri]NCD71316.1 DUF551 domain-containing protein [Mucilaginibacter agri]